MSAPTTSQPVSIAASPVTGVFISLAFWTTLAVSAALFAFLALAPRLFDWEKLQTQYAENATQIRLLREEIQHLQLLSQALEHDPDYAARLAIADLDVAPTGTFLVSTHAESPASSTARTPSKQPQPSLPLAEPTSTDSWYLPYLKEIAGPSRLRTRLIWTTALLCLLAFTCLNEEFIASRCGSSIGAVVGWWTRRYTCRD